MLASMREWLDRRTGYRKFMSVMLLEHIPGGAKWRYIWGSCLAFVFTIQLVTGVLLMTAYSPGDSTAWSSVYFIQYQMDFGWLIRGLHHFGSQAMVILLGLHMLQVVIAGAHLPPREVNWWLGLLLLGTVLGLSLTGYLLPWDQKGYWATQVATKIAGNLPLSGAWLQKVIVGGPAYGHHTLTRFYALHVAVLPPLLIALTILHLTVFRRHGVTVSPATTGEGWFWPDQAFRDLLAGLVIFGLMLSLVLMGHGHATQAPETAASQGWYERWAHAGQRGLGANLDAPADPSRPYPARPEWYFLFLFQLLKYFEGSQEIIGTVVIPNAVLLLLAILPLLGYGKMRPFGHVFGVLVVTGLLAGAGCLTCLAIAGDTLDPTARALIRRIGLYLIPGTAIVLLFFMGVLGVLERGAFRSVIYGVGVVVLTVLLVGSGGLLFAALNNRIPPQVAKLVQQEMKPEERGTDAGIVKFHEDQEKADKAAARALELAGAGVPAQGAVSLLRRDPVTQGPKLFGQHCAGCHNHTPEYVDTKDRKATASDLAGFGSEEWTFRLLKNPGHKDFFGRTGKTEMQEFIEGAFPAPKDKEELKPLARWLASHPRQTSPDRNSDWFKAAFARFKTDCMSCHAYEGKGSSKGPDLTGYGDAEWLRVMLMMPQSRWRYGINNTMPIFRDFEGPTGGVHKLEIESIRQSMRADPKNKKKPQTAIDKATQFAQLSPVERELLIRWLLHDNRIVFGGEPTAAVPLPEK